MQNSTQQVMVDKKPNFTSLGLFVNMPLSYPTKRKTQGIYSNVNFHLKDKHFKFCESKTLDLMKANNVICNHFVAALTYRKTGLGLPTIPTNLAVCLTTQQ